MADVSDSVLIQAEQIASASGVQLALDQALISAAAEFRELSELASELKTDVFQWILAGGEDHVLLATGASLPGVRIGSVVAGAGISGLEMQKAPVSWSHFTQ
jgi:thiamine-monophosphate kinase